jgi:abequosyltransferase
MQPNRPLLTIAIPTYKRGELLSQLLDVLVPQIMSHPEVELIISDNASPDGTSEVVQRFIDAGLPVRYHRHPENVGPDANFIFCLKQASGKYFWLCGDDDIILPGALDAIFHHMSRCEYDLIYVTGYGFHQDWLAERQKDPFDRKFHSISDASHLAKIVNVTFTFISGMIVNKDRLQSFPHEDPSAFIDTNLVQLSWVLPLLLHHRRSLVLWGRYIGARQGNAGGYSIGHIFGEKLIKVTNRCLPGRPDLAAYITDLTIRRWFPSIIYDIRSSGNQNLSIERAEVALYHAYGHNFRYWLFTYPVFKLPLPFARMWVALGKAMSQLIYMLTVPKFWRQEIS